MIPDQSFRRRRVRVANERSEAGPGGEDVSATDFDVGGEIVTDFFEDPADFFFLGFGLLIFLYRRGCVSRSGDRVSLPWKEEDYSAIAGGGVNKSHCPWGVVVREGDVNTGGGLDDGLVLWVVECEEGIGEWACGVDDALQTLRST